MHHWYHYKKPFNVSYKNMLSEIHIYNSLVVMQKGIPNYPVHSKVPNL